MEEYLQVKTGPLGQVLGIEPAVPRVRDGDAGNARAAEHGQGVGAGPARAPDPRRRPVRLRRRRRARDRPRRRDPAHARRRSPRSPVSGRSPVRAGRSPTTIADRELHRRGRGRHAGGDGGQRDAVRCATRWPGTRWRSTLVVVNALYPRALRRRRGGRARCGAAGRTRVAADPLGAEGGAVRAGPGGVPARAARAAWAAGDRQPIVELPTCSPSSSAAPSWSCWQTTLGARVGRTAAAQRSAGSSGRSAPPPGFRPAGPTRSPRR